ncbi:MAG: T9SS type A sorting domain-containing protein [Chitinophagales bacterium]|nr:T9SS type A sorting domain-containing protein [Bacteroidota bacterium]MCB9043244.1 T9SS type A sorting domain-containing protein [Chitinophagales bacterium]
MKKYIFLLYGCFVGSTLLSAQNVTYSEHIAPIIYQKCTQCHRPNEAAPMPFTNYSEVKSWANIIQYVTEIKYMPPWKPDPSFQHYLGENTLTDTEIQQIKDWVADGTPQGDPNLEPALPDFPEGSLLGEPDLVLSFAEAHQLTGNNVDEYRYFVLPTGLTEDKDIAAIELRPGNTNLVHHALFWNDDQGIAAAADAQTLEYGFQDSELGVSGITFEDQYPAYVPGSRPLEYNAPIGQKMKANSDLLLQVHYAPTPYDETDSSSVNIFFADKPISRYVQTYIMLPFFNTLLNGPFLIAANTVKEFHGVYTTPIDVSLVGVFPHMHKLGKKWEVFAVTPQNDTLNIIRINEWDFNWQGTYFFEKMIKIPAGSTIHGLATYDNTTNNPDNPNNPPVFVTWGEKTSDEMYYLAFNWLPYQAGDENLAPATSAAFTTDVVGTENFVLPKNKFYPIYPNPSNENCTISYKLVEPTTISIQVYNSLGELVQTILQNTKQSNGYFQQKLDLSALAAGNYTVILTANKEKLSQSLIVP